MLSSLGQTPGLRFFCVYCFWPHIWFPFTGLQNGLEGEIFGANMILSSTIERNNTMKNDPKYGQKSFQRNRVKESNNIEYIILKNFNTNTTLNKLNRSTRRPIKNLTKSHIKIQTPSSFIDHDVGLDLVSKTLKQVDSSNEILDIINFNGNQTPRSIHQKDNVNLWNLVNKEGHGRRFRAQHQVKEPSGSGTNDLPTISEYETPPPLKYITQNYLENKVEIEQPVSESFYKITDETSTSTFSKSPVNEISDIELPPPPNKDNKVYGQWTSSKYAGSVLNYLKSINFHIEKKVPPTIPLNKLSDSHPYPSDLKLNILRPPVQLQRRNFVIEKRFPSQNAYTYQNPIKSVHMSKRAANTRQINVQILENNFRNDILKTHAQTQPKNVHVTNRGQGKIIKNHRFYRNVDSQSSEDVNSDNVFKPSSFSSNSNKNSQFSYFDANKSNSLLSVLPFLKSVEYFTGDYDMKIEQIANNNDMYSKSLSSGNKWHNVMSYNNDYTPRRVDMKPEDGKSDLDYKIDEANKRHPSIRLKYKPESNKIVHDKNDERLLKGRQMAVEVSNQSDYNKDSISILKYNHGFLPGHIEKKVTKGNPLKHPRINEKTNSFNKQVKLGNALNEQTIIGVNEEQKKRNFVGGNEKIPDINRYRSDIDNETENVPSSLSPRICKNVELYDHLLYVQPDESIDMTHILSPVKSKNIGIEFVIQNYKKCSLEESSIEKSHLLLINWNLTPVRLFGGAYPLKTTDLCGFF